jgi:hypothetical protein
MECFTSIICSYKISFWFVSVIFNLDRWTSKPNFHQKFNQNIEIQPKFKFKLDSNTKPVLF